MEPTIKINILEVKNPSHFNARIVLPWEEETYMKACNSWQDDMYKIEKTAVGLNDVNVAEVYAAKNRKDGSWHRVRVDQMVHTGRGRLASCFFVDSGEKRELQLNRLYTLPDKYQNSQVPFLVRTLKLWGLQPMSLVIETTDNGIRVPHRPTNKWDTSAAVYFRELIGECDQATVRVKGWDTNGRLLVVLHLRDNDHTINVNEELIKEKYACPLDTDAGLQSDSSSSRQSPEGLSGSEMLRKRLSPASDKSSETSVSGQSPAFSPQSSLSSRDVKRIMAKIKQTKVGQKTCHKDSNSVLGSRNISRPGSIINGDGDTKESVKVASLSSVAKRQIDLGNNEKNKKELSEVDNNHLSNLLVDISDSCPAVQVSQSSSLVSASSNYLELKSLLCLPDQSCSDNPETGSVNLPTFTNSARSGTDILESIPLSATRSIVDTNIAPCSPTASVPSLASTSSASGVMVAGIGLGCGRGRGKNFPSLLSRCLENNLITGKDHNTLAATGTQKLSPKLDVNNRKPVCVSDMNATLSQPSVLQSDMLQSNVPLKIQSDIMQEMNSEKLPDVTDESSTDSTSPVDLSSVSKDVEMQHEQKQSGCVKSDSEKNGKKSTMSSAVGPHDLRGMDVNMLDKTSDGEGGHIKRNGSRLMDLLKKKKDVPDVDGGGVKVPLVWRPDRPMPAPFLGTMVWGSHYPCPVYDVNDIPFLDIVKQFMLKEGFKTPRAIQAHTWPAILRGRHIVGISPPKSGKMTAYLPPLLTMLSRFEQYVKLPRGMGPKAIILVPSYKRSEDIIKYVRSIIKEKTTLRVLGIYGAADHQVMPLLRGCDLLVATTHSLLRMLDQRYTQLDRLCHLILDDADDLIEDSASQVHEVMKRYEEILRKYKGLPVVRQLMVFSTMWTTGVSAYQKKYLLDPVVVFASRLEASVYGKVKQVVHMCFHEKLLSTLRDVIQQLMANPDQLRIIITVSDSQGIEKIEQLLDSLCVYAQVINQNSTMSEIDDKVIQWQDQSGSSVLVVTDENISELRVTCAHVVIHCDIPNSKTKFGNRLALMLDHFQDSCTDGKRKGIQPVSHLLVTNKKLEHVESLHSFLQRSSATIPPAMQSVLDGMHAAKNENENRPFCQQLRQFGVCRNGLKCQSRHLVLSCDAVSDNSLESWLPESGTVKVRVLHVLDASHYYAIPLEHHLPGQKCRDLQTIHTSMLMDLAIHFSNVKNHEPFDLKEGLNGPLAAVQDQEGSCFRVRALSYIQSTVTSSSQVEVFYVDEGYISQVYPDQLLKLPEKLQQIPPLAVEIFICGMKPVDGDADWSRTATDYVKEELKCKDVYGNVALRMKNTLWLDHLSHRAKLQNVKASIFDKIIRPELHQRGLADDNPNHLKNLYRLCEGKIPIDERLYDKYLNLPTKKISAETLKCDQENRVCVSLSDDPHHFFVQKLGPSNKKLENMQEKLNKYMEKILADEEISLAAEAKLFPSKAVRQKPATDTPQQTRAEVPESTGIAGNSSKAAKGLAGKEVCGDPSDFEPGSVCVAKFAEDGRWYRARVLEQQDDGLKVFFIDHGDRNVVAESNLHHIPDKFCQLPAQAIECALIDVNPTGDQWNAETADVMSDLAFSCNGEKKTLFATVQEIERAQFSRGKKYLIELADRSSFRRELHFSQELVRTHVAATYNEDLKNLFPRVEYQKRKMYSNLDQKIGTLCAALYWSQAEEEAKKLAQLISENVLTYITTIAIMKPDHSCLTKMVQLIGYLRFSDVHSTILSTVVSCVEVNPELCVAVIGEDLVMRLAFCLEQVRNPSVQLQAAIKIEELAKIREFTECLDQREVIGVCIDVLDANNSSSELFGRACSFLVYMLQFGEQCALIAESRQLVNVVIDIMSEITELDKKESLLALLAALAHCKNLHSAILREKSMGQILGVIKTAPSQKCVFLCARVFQCLCSSQAHRRNKRILLEGELVLIINKLLEKGVQSPAKEMCDELLKSLTIYVPQQESISGVTITPHPTVADSHIIKTPPIKWSQNSFRVLITVTVEGAKESDFEITENGISFRCESKGIVYGFDYTLFGTLVPEKCQVVVGHAEVNISLAKKERGKWSRLLKKKQKCANVVTDFDKLVDSSDSEIEEYDNITVLARKMKRIRQPKQTNDMEENPEDWFSCDPSNSDSEEDIACYSNEEDGDLIDPVSVMEDMIHGDAGPKPSKPSAE